MTDLPHQWLGFVDPDDELGEAVAAQFSQHPDAAIITSFPGLGV